MHIKIFGGLMKKLITICCFILGAMSFIHAQKVDWKDYAECVKDGDFIVQGNIGLTGHSEAFPYGTSMRIPYLEASVEYLKKIGELPFGFGGFVGYSQEKIDESTALSEWSGSMNYINVGLFSNYHIKVPVEKLDLYAGLCFGLEFWNWKYDYTYDEVTGYDTSSYSYKPITEKVTKTFDANGHNFFVGANLGAKYFFNERFAANLQVGYPGFIKVGGSVKF